MPHLDLAVTQGAPDFLDSSLLPFRLTESILVWATTVSQASVTKLTDNPRVSGYAGSLTMAERPVVAGPAMPKRGQTELFLSWDGTPESSHNVLLLRKFLLAKHYFIHEHAGSVFGNGSVLAEVSPELIETLRRCTVFLVCVSREYTKNINSKKLCLLARKMLDADRKNAPELLYAMIDGNFTTESQPHKVSGWLGFLLKDALWSPAWSHAHASGAAEAVAGTVKLRRNVVMLSKEQLRRIDRGEENTALKSPARSSPKSGSGKASIGKAAEGFPVGATASSESLLGAEGKIDASEIEEAARGAKDLLGGPEHASVSAASAAAAEETEAKAPLKGILKKKRDEVPAEYNDEYADETFD